MLFTDTSLVEEFEAELAETNTQISKLQARQLVILNQLERARIPQRDGARSMAEWTATTLDVTAGTAKELVAAANRLGRDPWLFEQMEAGKLTLGRAMTTLRLAAADAPTGVVDRSFDLDLATVSRLIHKFRRIQRTDERQVFNDRHFVIQPSLDESRWRGWFELPGVDGKILDMALADRTDELRTLPVGEYFTRGQLQADAIVAMSQDSLGRDGGEDGVANTPGVVLFVDLDQTNNTGGELGAEVEYGPRVGPEALEEMLCTGSVQLVGLDNGRPVVTSENTKVIPPAAAVAPGHVTAYGRWDDFGVVGGDDRSPIVQSDQLHR
ncbi:MAG: DUF222 domain-containing protein [Actinomycetota bacterium]|nr:DUF222 domain-containing protein [Actinomycetota bacterium]